LIAQSQSGTGKTAAFVLAMLSRVDPELQYPQVILIPIMNFKIFIIFYTVNKCIHFR
jgi:superfamily II DNA/RNA helicase